MKSSFFLFILFFSAVCIGTDLVPLQKYNKMTSNLWPESATYLFNAIGKFVALYPANGDKAELLARFKSLPIVEQLTISSVLSKLKNNEKIKNSFLPSYDSVKIRLDKSISYDIFVEPEAQTRLLFISCLTTLEEDIEARKELYDAVKWEYSSSIKYKANEEEFSRVEYLANVSCKKILQYSTSQEEKEEALNFIVEFINNVEYLDVKSRLTYSFLQYFSKEQISRLKTTEYSFLSGMFYFIVLGKFKDFIPIYYEIAKNSEKYIPEEKFYVEDLLFSFPDAKGKTFLEVITFLLENQDNITFDKKNLRYHIKK